MNRIPAISRREQTLFGKSCIGTIWHKDKSIDGCFDWQKEKEKGEVMDKAWNKQNSLLTLMYVQSYECVV